MLNKLVIEVGPFHVNSFLLWDDPEKALLIDAGADAELICKWIKRRGLTVEAQLLTHGHVDHVSASAELAEVHPSPVFMHARDAMWAFSPAAAFAPFYPRPRKPSALETSISDGRVLSFGVGEVEVLGTPGHSAGSVCFLLRSHDTLIAGDTLFAGSVGRTDLPGGDPEAQTESLKRLSQLPPNLRILCGHGPQTTMEEELTHNPYLRAIEESKRA